jgi:FkbM family methyltransferase
VSGDGQGAAPSTGVAERGSVVDRLRARWWRVAGVHLSNLARITSADRPTYVEHQVRAAFGWRSTGRVRVPDVRHPLMLRFGSSDAEVLHQVFARQEYACCRELKDINFVLDLGANVGYSSVWFANVFPDARIVAVEPDASNAALARANLCPYGERVRVVEAAIWDRPTGLVLDRTYRDGREWSVTVREAGAGEAPDTRALDIASLLAEEGMPTIDLLKMDIEGAERVLFRHRSDEWLRRTRNYVVELHDKECESLCNKALAGFEAERRRSGDLTVFLGLRARAPT